LGHLDRAEVRLSSLIAWSPLDIDAMTELAEIKLEKGVPGEAAQLLRRVLEERPNHFDALFLLGNAFMDVGAMREAENAYSLSLETNPFSAQAWYNLARCRHQLDDAASAISAYEAYLRAAPQAEDRRQVTEWMESLEATLP